MNVSTHSDRSRHGLYVTFFQQQVAHVITQKLRHYMEENLLSNNYTKIIIYLFIYLFKDFTV